MTEEVSFLLQHKFQYICRNNFRNSTFFLVHHISRQKFIFPFGCILFRICCLCVNHHQNELPWGQCHYFLFLNLANLYSDKSLVKMVFNCSILNALIILVRLVKSICVFHHNHYNFDFSYLEFFFPSFIELFSIHFYFFFMMFHSRISFSPIPNGIELLYM